MPGITGQADFLAALDALAGLHQGPVAAQMAPASPEHAAEVEDLDGAVREISFTKDWIPYLTFQDVNGDRRPDLLVIDNDYRAFHIQREDGSVPPEPDWISRKALLASISPENMRRNSS